MRSMVRRVLTAATVAAGAWAWPIAAPHPVVHPFVAPATAYSAGHRGIDIAADQGSVVRAPAGGVVRFAGVVVDRPVLTIDHGGGVLSSYEPVVTTLPVGSVVARGQPIGTVSGATHCDPSSCLHLGVRVDGRYVSPLLFLGGVPRAILYPVRGSP